MSRGVMQQALDALEAGNLKEDQIVSGTAGHLVLRMPMAAIAQMASARDALRSELAQPQAEPVATVLDGGDCFRLAAYLPPGTKLYATPQQAQPEWNEENVIAWCVARGIEAAAPAVPAAPAAPAVPVSAMGNPISPMKPLSGDVLFALWASENGLEDCKMCKLNDFTKAARFFEQAHGIAAPGEKV